ncbi:MAG: hypothetical protein CL913_03500 [Deltaproteobacteria bacterium]|nr:hypothetical protein [Deltaproteobacteria bacterium]
MNTLRSKLCSSTSATLKPAKQRDGLMFPDPVLTHCAMFPTETVLPLQYLPVEEHFLDCLKIIGCFARE